MSTFVTEVYEKLTSMNARQYITQFITLGLVVSSALSIWRTLILYTDSISPVVVVLRFEKEKLTKKSGSMETAMFRGDLLYLTNWKDPYRVGEITVFKIRDKEIPIVHRLIRVHEKKNLKFDMLTKGDNNPVGRFFFNFCLG
jgi:signal peptidase I